MKISDFEQECGTTLKIVEISKADRQRWGVKRFCASWRNVEIKDGCMLISESGRGDTPQAAVFDYMKKISGRTIVVNGSANRRRIIKLPEFTVNEQLALKTRISAFLFRVKNYLFGRNKS
jgi:hypothetical protein